MKKRVLVTGASGFIGGVLSRMLAADENIVLFSGCLTGACSCGEPVRFDLRDASSVNRVIEKVSPDLVIHCAYDNTANNRYDVIVNGTRNLVNAVNAVSPAARLLFLSSEWVFDGSAGPYSETDIPRPNTEYGRSKLEAEAIVQQQLADNVIVRTGLVSCESPLAPRWLVEDKKLLAGQKVVFYSNEIRNPIHVDDLCRAIMLLESSGENGIWHIAGPEYLSRFDELKLFARWRGFDESLIGSGISDGVNRPLDCSIKIDKFLYRFDLKIRSPKDYFV